MSCAQERVVGDEECGPHSLQRQWLRRAVTIHCLHSQACVSSRVLDGHETSPANEDACENNFSQKGERPGGVMPSGDAQDRVFSRIPPLTNSK